MKRPAWTLALILHFAVHSAALADPVEARRTNEFLDSIGVASTFPDRGQPLAKTIEMVRYGGFRWVRGGIEGLSETGPTTVKTFLDLHAATGVKFSWGLVSGGSDLPKLIATARILAGKDALLAFEGNNEPNNWGITYNGEEGGRDGSWLAIAKLQRDLYRSVKSDPLLAKYPVWSISEPGAQTDNVGLQFLEIPQGAQTIMPAGTRYADYANVHNYIYHPNSPQPEDNKTWNAADPTEGSSVDGLYGNYGRTWRNGFIGYSPDQLEHLPRVTTETGANIGDGRTEDLQAVNLLNIYLAQFARGYAYTSIYILRDRTDEQGNQTFGFFTPEYKPRKAARYLHNLTTILRDRRHGSDAGTLDYSILSRPPTVHDLLLQNSKGIFQLVVWNERLEGSDSVTVQFSESPASVSVYDPTRGTAAIEKHGRVDKIDLVLTDHPLILNIRMH